MFRHERAERIAAAHDTRAVYFAGLMHPPGVTADAVVRWLFADAVVGDHVSSFWASSRFSRLMAVISGWR